MTTQTKHTKELRKLKREWYQVLKKAYQQSEDVDSENLLKGFRHKVGDPNGWDYLFNWTWNWIEKALTSREEELIDEGFKPDFVEE